MGMKKPHPAALGAAGQAMNSTQAGLIESKGRDLHILIAGGSIAGLTLAHCLHHLKISYTVLEAHPELSPNAGASIVLMPNGARILDQLGLYGEICRVSEPLSRTKTWNALGKNLIDTNGPALIEKRHGYPLSVLRRMDLLKVLAEGLPEKTRVKTGKRVVRIEHSEGGVAVHCGDGTVYHGDVIVGADGIHSTVRKCMQEHIESLQPGKTRKDREGISAEYNCIFGLGGPIAGSNLTPRDSHRTYSSGRSTLAFVGGEGELYWFLFSKLDRRYFGNEIPRYSKEDAEEAAKGFFELSLDDGNTFKDVWETRTSAEMTAVEEAQCENWTYDRFVCLGDAVHKVSLVKGGGDPATCKPHVLVISARLT